MRHDELTGMVVESRRDDWEPLEQGPYYADGFWMESSGNEHRLGTKWHDWLAVYKPDVDLRLAWGMTHRDDYQLPEPFIWPNRKIYLDFVDAFWRGSLVARWRVLNVDGGACYHPEPDRASVNTGDSLRDWETVGWTVKASEVKLCRLLQSFSMGEEHNNFDDFFRPDRIVVVPD
jgi:hypothetical protein